MWSKLFTYFRSLLSVFETLQGLRKDVDDVQDEMQKHALALQIMAREMEHQKTFEAQEREKLELRIKLALSEARNQNQLPPVKEEK